MNPQETESILTVALMAAFADGTKSEREREAVRRVADALGADAAIDLPRLYREALTSDLDLAAVTRPLESLKLKQLAYEMATGVIEADGERRASESDFLGRLAATLNLPNGMAGSLNEAADALAVAAEGAVTGDARLNEAELDKKILNASVTNAALELLPESLASLAIIPLQMRLVYRIAQAYGYDLDRRHARDFVATLGVGLTSQYLEQFGRKLLGGVLGGIGGKLGGAVGRQAASSGLSFATTYALGRVAQRYYQSGRTLDAETLKRTFASLMDEARGLAPRYQEEIRKVAANLDTSRLSSLIKKV
jgi:uncharacterized protein (DUF697 family)/uncharacterized tellurite resistance protein B-like protein